MPFDTGAFLNSPGYAGGMQGLQNIAALRRDQVPTTTPADAYQQSVNRQALIKQREKELDAEMEYRNRMLAQQQAEQEAMERYRSGSLGLQGKQLDATIAQNQGQLALQQGQLGVSQQNAGINAQQVSNQAAQFEVQREQDRQQQVQKILQWEAEGVTEETDALTGQVHRYNPRTQQARDLLTAMGLGAQPAPGPAPGPGGIQPGAVPPGAPQPGAVAPGAPQPGAVPPGGTQPGAPWVQPPPGAGQPSMPFQSQQYQGGNALPSQPMQAMAPQTAQLPPQGAPAGAPTAAPAQYTGSRAPQYPAHVIASNQKAMEKFYERQSEVPAAIENLDQFDRFLTPLMVGEDFNLGPIESEMQQMYPARLVGTDAQKKTDELKRFTKERVLDLAEQMSGALSERDMIFLEQAVPGENAEEDEWVNYLYEARARIMTAAELQRQQQNYVNEKGHLVGFNETRQRMKIRDRFMANQDRYQDILKSMAQSGQPIDRDAAWTLANKPAGMR